MCMKKAKMNGFTSTDFVKYTNKTKFNLKNLTSGLGIGSIFVDDTSFNLTSGLCIGSIFVDDTSFNLLFTQVKIVMNIMFNIIPLSRSVHFVGNRGLKVWSK